MTKLSVSLAVTAVALLSASACERNQIEREAEDVKDAQQDVREQKQEVRQEVRDEKQEVAEEKAELREEKVELAVEAKEQIAELEQRYAALEKQAETVMAAVGKAGATKTDTEQRIQQAKMLAQAKLEAARKADTPDAIATSINEARTAVDQLDDLLDDYDDV